MDDGHASSRHYVSEAAVHTSQPLSSFHNRQSSDLSARHVSASAGSGSPRRAATMRTRTCSTCTETRGQALFISRAPGTRRHRVPEAEKMSFGSRVASIAMPNTTFFYADETCQRRRGRAMRTFCCVVLACLFAWADGMRVPSENVFVGNYSDPNHPGCYLLSFLRAPTKLSQQRRMCPFRTIIFCTPSLQAALDLSRWTARGDAMLLSAPLHATGSRQDRRQIRYGAHSKLRT